MNATDNQRSLLSSQKRSPASQYVGSQSTDSLSNQRSKKSKKSKMRKFLKSGVLYRYAYFAKGALGCLGGLFIHLVIGSLYQWGLLSPYITSYFQIVGQEELKSKDTAVVFPLMMFCIGITMFSGLRLSDQYGELKLLVGSTIALSACVFASSFISNIIGFVALYSIGFGLFAGLTFMVPMRLCNSYFPNKQTYVNGMILIGTGLGSVVFGLFSIGFVNPYSLSPDQNGYYVGDLSYIAHEVPICIRWLSLLYLVTGLAGSLLLIPTMEFNEQQSEMERTIISPTFVDHMLQSSGTCLSVKQSTRSHLFYLHIIIIVCACCGNLFINSNYKIYARKIIPDDNFLTLIGVLGSIANGVTRFFWSMLFNRIGYKYIMTLFLTVNIACLSALKFTVEMELLYMAVIVVSNAVLGGLLVIAPTYSTVVFGKQIGSKIFGVFWCSFAIGNFVQYLYVVTLQELIGLNNIIYICLGMNIISLAIIMKCKFKAKWKNDPKYFKFKMLPTHKIVTDNSELLIYSVLSNRKKGQLYSSYAAHSTTIYS